MASPTAGRQSGSVARSRGDPALVAQESVLDGLRRRRPMLPSATRWAWATVACGLCRNRLTRSRRPLTTSPRALARCHLPMRRRGWTARYV